LPPERELAASLEVNRLTLRKALDLLAGDGLVSRQQGRATFVRHPAEAASARRRVVYVGSTREHFYQELHAHLCEEGQHTGAALAAFNPAAGELDREQLSALVAEAEAIICVNTHWRRVCTFIPAGVRVVRVTGFESFEPEDAREGDRGCVVTTDTYRAAKLAVEHLCAEGHRRIALMDAGHRQTGDPLLWSVRPRRAPYLGYRSALREAGIDEELVLGTTPQPTDDWKDEAYHAAIRFLKLQQEWPTAFVCVGDFRAAPLIRAAADLGLDVPRRLSVVGMGNTPWSQWITPPLTTMAMGERDMARIALLLATQSETDSTSIFRVNPYLVKRQSVASLNETSS
jgi:DNA-binding LacI/PurR family transcriptional regulator